MLPAKFATSDTGFDLSHVPCAHPHHPSPTRMFYTPTLRQVVLIPTVPVTFWLGSVLSHTKLVGASLARGPKQDVLDPAAAQAAEAQRQSRLLSPLLPSPAKLVQAKV
jgi:hypothetical protein